MRLLPALVEDSGPDGFSASVHNSVREFLRRSTTTLVTVRTGKQALSRHNYLVCVILKASGCLESCCRIAKEVHCVRFKVDTLADYCDGKHLSLELLTL